MLQLKIKCPTSRPDKYPNSWQICQGTRSSPSRPLVRVPYFMTICTKGVYWRNLILLLGRKCHNSDLYLFQQMSEGILQVAEELCYKPGSITDEVIEFFNWPNPSSRTMAMVSTRPLKEMSTRNLTGGKGWLAHKAYNLNAISEASVLKMWGPQHLTSLHGLLQRQLYHFFYLYQWGSIIWFNYSLNESDS
jgi:hypothetical protein